MPKTPMATIPPKCPVANPRNKLRGIINTIRSSAVLVRPICGQLPVKSLFIDNLSSSTFILIGIFCIVHVRIIRAAYLPERSKNSVGIKPGSKGSPRRAQGIWINRQDCRNIATHQILIGGVAIPCIVSIIVLV
jgi:hypothetical protein